MENASKALLIAAGVLIVILLIAFGMTILNSSGDTSAQIQEATSSQEMQAFNAKFTPYIGTGRSGSTIPNLLALVNATNKGTKDVTVVVVPSSSGTQTALVTGAATAVPTKMTSVSTAYTPGTALSTTKKYTITASYGADGYIYAITIK